VPVKEAPAVADRIIDCVDGVSQFVEELTKAVPETGMAGRRRRSLPPQQAGADADRE
jgi:hypothetical protein